jgi:SAM-dependent methyltransferase
MNTVHPMAQSGYSEGAGAYERGRPDYPRELLSWLRHSLRLGQGRGALDLGAGTGKFTRLLLETGAEVIAVEPVDAMRDALSAALPGVDVRPGTAQTIPAETASVDAVVCAQSFHWFARGEAVTEIHRVLRPGGRLGLVWNVRDETINWVAATTRMLRPYEGNAPRFHTGEWRQPFDGRLFTDLVETRFSYRHIGAAQEVIVDRFMSVSFIAALPPDQKAKIAAKLDTLIATHAGVKGRDIIEMPYLTRAFHCARK